MQHLEPVDMLGHIRLGLNSLVGGLDPTNKHMPYWSIGFAEGELGAFRHSGAWDWCHDVARAIHAIGMVERATGECIDEAIWNNLADLQIALFDEADNLPGTADNDTGERFVHLHNIRESTHALNCLILRGDERARDWSRRMIRTTRAALDEDGAIQLDRLPSYVLEYNHQPSQEGRAVDALVRHYRITGDEIALELAGLMTSYALKHCFTPEGALREAAGTHGHSLNAIVAGMLDLALLTNNTDLLNRVKAIYDVGCPRFNSSFGWSMESLHKFHPRGESNNTGDLLRAALLLGHAGWANYFEDAERILRGHLLPSQVIDVDDLSDDPDETDDSLHRRASRLRGGFSFPTPNDYLLRPDATITTYDITSGAVDGMCEALSSIITSDDAGVRINLLFNHEAEGVRLTSHLSQTGCLEIENRSGRPLLVRIPSWVDKKEVRLEVNGVESQKIFIQSYLLSAGNETPSSNIITFPMREARTVESICFENYTIDWRGDQIVAMSPPAKHRPMFPPCE